MEVRVQQCAARPQHAPHFAHAAFEVGRVTRRDPTATIDEWVKAFKGKRTEIVSAHCAP